MLNGQLGLFAKTSRVIFDAKVEEVSSLVLFTVLLFYHLLTVLITITRLRRRAPISSPLCLTEKMSAPRRSHLSPQGADADADLHEVFC